MSKYGVVSGPYFPAFGLNTERYYFPAFGLNTVRDTSYLSVLSPNAGKYEPEITPYLDTFHAVQQVTKYILKNNGLPSFVKHKYHNHRASLDIKS